MVAVVYGTVNNAMKVYVSLGQLVFKLVLVIQL